MPNDQDNINEHILVEFSNLNESIRSLETALEGIMVNTEPQEVRKFELVGAQIEVMKGDKGDKGDKGEKGDRGEKGDAGDKGERGEKGEQGDKGDRGDKGDAGRDGKDGKNGIDGVDGLPGSPGRDGKDGRDGSPDTGEQIVSKLKSLPKGKRFNYDDLDGTPNIPTLIKSSKTVSLVELDDVDLSGVTKTNGKYILGSGGGGGGAVDSVNGQTGVVVLTTANISDSNNKRYVTEAEKTVLSNTSGTNTGDQDLSPYFNKSVDDTDDITEGTTKKFATAAEKTKLGHITVTQAIDLDQIELDTATNNAKVSNATHTGEVTGSTALTLDKTAITNRTSASPETTDEVLISDASDSGNLKRVTVGDLLSQGGFIGVRTTQSAGQSITANTLTPVQFDTESYDTDSMHSTSSNNTRITFNTAGYYFITGAVSTDANAGSYGGVRLNGSTYINKIGIGNVAVNTANGIVVAFPYYFATNDYIELMATFGTTQTTKSGADGSFFGAHKIAHVPTGSQNVFSTFAVAGQSDVVADSTTDTLTLVAGSNVTITTNAATDTITISASGGGGVSDGDKGDITVSGSGATWTIDNGVVSLAKQADVATSTVFYRKTAGTGAPEVQTLATLKTDLGLTGTNSGDQTSIVGITGTKDQFDTAVTDGNFLYVGDVTQYTDEMAQDAVGAMVDSTLVYTDGTPLLSRAALTGDVTASAGSNSTTIAADAVTYAKMQNVSATDRLLGRVSAGSGDVEEIVFTDFAQTLIDDADATAARSTLGLGTLATQNGTFSGTSSGTNTGDQTITLTGDVTGSGTGSFAATIANNVVTNAKLAQVATATFKGRVTASTGNVEDLTGTQATTLLDVFTTSLKGLAPASGGGTTNFLRADGTWAAPPGGGSMAIGGSITSATAGSILFAGTSGVLQQDNTNFFWDDTNNDMRIGPTDATITSGSNRFSVIHNANTFGGIYVRNPNTGNRAVADLILSNDLGGVTDYFEIGVNGSGNTDPAYPIMTPNDVLFHASGGLDSMRFVVSDSAEEYSFSIGGLATTNRRMTLTATGLTVGLAGTQAGNVLFSGSTSGTTTLTAAATASGTLTLPAATDTLVGRATTDTLTNKRITKRVQSVTSSATVTPSWDNDDMVKITAQAAGLTLANPSGTATEGQVMIIRIEDDGTSRSINYGTQYRAIGVTLPTATTATKTTYLGCVWNLTDSTLDVLSVNTQA